MWKQEVRPPSLAVGFVQVLYLGQAGCENGAVKPLDLEDASLWRSNFVGGDINTAREKRRILEVQCW